MAISPGSNNKGSTDYARSPRWWHWNHPRIRGVHYDANTALANESGSSPHTRGPRSSSSESHSSSRIIPAYAGPTYYFRFLQPPLKVHLRIRGAHVTLVQSGFPSLGSSPHTRGPPGIFERRMDKSRFIPAYAGSTLRSLRWLSTTRDHPRIRGVHGIISSRVMKTQGLSPHTRGPRNGSPQLHPPCRIIPAYAGSTLGQ